MKIAVLGAGAFGTALAIALARGGERIGLWARNPDHADEIRRTEQNTRHLAGSMLPETVSVSAKIADFDAAGTFLLAMPMQQLGGFLDAHCDVLAGKAAVACAKGIDLSTGLGPTALIRRACPSATPAMLTGPSFAADIARGLPTALALACEDEAKARALQHELTAPMLRLYRTTDVRGAELGGALKNVVAIAAGVVIGAGLGDSARAALMTRGFAEMTRLAVALGARPETLAGLSGFGDLVLTCTSPQSRNFRFGQALGSSQTPEAGVTVEGIATARAVAGVARAANVDMPVADMVVALVDRRLTVDEAVSALLARPLKEE